MVGIAAGSARACPIGRPGDPPCKKNRLRGRQDVVLEETPIGYMRRLAGTPPRRSHARIEKFLTAGTWAPITPKRMTKKQLAAFQVGSGRVTYVRPPPIAFATAANITPAPPGTSLVLVRRIEQHGDAILVEVDDQTWRLTACATKRGYACLVGTELVLDPIEPAP